MENTDTCACNNCGCGAAAPSSPLRETPAQDLTNANARIHIEWRHLDKGGKTCGRCGKTGNNLKQAIAELETEYKQQGITIDFVETKLGTEHIRESNLILINGIPLEILLPKAQAVESNCLSCSCLIGKTASCRAIKLNNELYEDIPAELIRQAVYNHLNPA